MPGAAIGTGAVDRVLPLDGIAPALIELTAIDAEATSSDAGTEPGVASAGEHSQAPRVPEEQPRASTSRGYKRSSLIAPRRRSGCSEVGVAAFADYIDYLEVHPDEFRPLFNTILINVTAFFRDPSAWEYLAERDRAAHPRRAGRRTSPIRVWSAGCASGEEAYTLAILLAEALGRGRVPRAGEDLRHRRRRGGARPGAPGELQRARRSQAGAAGAAASSYFERDGRPLRVPQGPAALA